MRILGKMPDSVVRTMPSKMLEMILGMMLGMMLRILLASISS